MRLLQSEIDVTPGVQPNLGARPEGWVGVGSAILEVTNEGDLENAFVLRLECDHAYWQPSWAQFTALPPQGDANKPPAGKPDQPGPKNSTLKLHLGRGMTRQAMIAFRLPRTSEARAGVYNLRVVVETAIAGSNGTERFTEFPATLIVRPFYDFSIEEGPSERRTGRLRRRADFNVRVVSRGNDWLYLDLKPGKHEALSLDVPAVRLAVPPPEPGAEADRTLPVEARTRLKVVKGNAVKTPLPLEATRVDAPSVPPLSVDAPTGGPAMPGVAVLATETREPAPVVEPAELVYHPPIPGSLVGFGQALMRNVKGLLLAFVAVVALVTAGAVLYERTMHKMNSLRIDAVGRDSEGNALIPNGGSFTVRGEWLDRAVFELYTDQDPNTPAETFSSDDKAHVKLVSAATERKRAVADVRGKMADATSHVYLATITPTLQDTVIKKVTARRRLPILGAFGLLPGNSLPIPIRVGAEPAKAVKRDGPHLAAPELNPDDPIVLTGGGFGPKGKVTVGGVTIGDATWTDEKITAKVPPEYGTSGKAFNVVVTFADGSSEQISGLKVVAEPDPSKLEKDGKADPNNPDDPDNPPAPQPDPNPVPPDPNPTPQPEKPAKPKVAPAAGYEEALQAFGGNSIAWGPAASAAGGDGAEARALRAYALASAGKPDRAQAAIKDYLAEGGMSGLSEREQAYVGAAISRIVESLQPGQAATVADRLSGLCREFTTARAGSSNPGDAFPYLAYAAFLARQPNHNLGAPATPLKKLGAGATEAERQAAARLKNP